MKRFFCSIIIITLLMITVSFNTTYAANTYRDYLHTTIADILKDKRDTKTERFMRIYLRYVTRIDEEWVYSQSPKYSAKRANCSCPVSWALRKMDIIDSDEQVYIGKGNNINNESKLKKGGLVGHSGDGKTAEKLIDNKKLKEGDIVFWKDIMHTSVYAGDGKFYDTGKSATTDSKNPGGHYIVKKLQPRKACLNKVVYKYYRFKN